ncbi:unnamed protein product [Symbiodinium sp. CCMP2592]|nr:unnamed protein product [Symbiodinium sp. CCMP2592]
MLRCFGSVCSNRDRVVAKSWTTGLGSLEPRTNLGGILGGRTTPLRKMECRICPEWLFKTKVCAPILAAGIMQAVLLETLCRRPWRRDELVRQRNAGKRDPSFTSPVLNDQTWAVTIDPKECSHPGGPTSLTRLS